MSRLINIIGVTLDAITYEEIFSQIDSWLSNKSGRSHHIAPVNAYCVTLALKNSRLQRIYNGADIVGPDGIPFVRWIRRINKTPCDHICAPELLVKIAERAKKLDYSVYLLGGSEKVLDKMRANLIRAFPYLNIVGHYSPPFRPLSAEEDTKIVESINKLMPDIIFVGLGTPKQDYWIDKNLASIKGAVIIGSGATFDFWGGRIKMAPDYVRRAGVEWIFRLLSKDFLRLLRRYTSMNCLFLFTFALQIVGLIKKHNTRWRRPEHT